MLISLTSDLTGDSSCYFEDLFHIEEIKDNKVILIIYFIFKCTGDRLSLYFSVRRHE